MRRGWGQRGASIVGWAFLRPACRPGRACPPSDLALRSVFASRPRRVRSFLQIVSLLVLRRRKAEAFRPERLPLCSPQKIFGSHVRHLLPAGVNLFFRQCASGRALSDLLRFSACFLSPAPPSARFLDARLPPPRSPNARLPVQQLTSERLKSFRR